MSKVVKIQNTEIRKDGFTSLKAFKKAFEGKLKGDLKKHYNTVTGKKVK